jgi:hypothetical protein
MAMTFLVLPLALLVWKLAYGPRPPEEHELAPRADVAELLQVDPPTDLQG